MGSIKITPTDTTYRALIYAFDYFNQALFNSSLPPVVFTYHRQRRVMGYASFGRWADSNGNKVDELAINPEYFAKYPLIEICQTLVHEMVHIWQTHFGTPSRRNYHNKQWAKKMIEVGLMPSSTGVPGGDTTGESMMDYVLTDGKFLETCRILRKQGYRIPLVDRYPIFRRETPILAYSSEGIPFELDKRFRIKKTSIARIEPPTTMNSTITTEESVENIIQWQEINNNQATLESFIGSDTSKTKQKSGRIKYCCKQCQTLIWAKRGLNIACLDCEQKFTQSE